MVPNKPTGLERTWPNVLNREGVRGHEYQITRYRRRLDADHDTILPFTRYIAGPADYTPTVFESKELQGNTWAHELAQAVIFTAPIFATAAIQGTFWPTRHSTSLPRFPLCGMKPAFCLAVSPVS